MNLDDVAYLFVEQYENIHGLYSESYRQSEVDLIRRTADKGEAALYTVVATIFGDKLDEVLVGAANGAMDYIAYVDETWDPKDAEDKAKVLTMEAVHLESLEALLYMAQMNECSVINELEKIEKQAKKLSLKEINGQGNMNLFAYAANSIFCWYLSFWNKSKFN